MIPITGLYTGLTILIAVVLALRIGARRSAKKISILHGEDMELATRTRVHANLVETAALTLFAMAVIEMGGADAVLLHGLGIVYILARIAHAVGLRHDQLIHPLRMIGAMGSMLVMLAAGAIAIWQYASKALGV